MSAEWAALQCPDAAPTHGHVQAVEKDGVKPSSLADLAHKRVTGVPLAWLVVCTCCRQNVSV